MSVVKNDNKEIETGEVKIDFTKYTMQELIDCRENIDKELYPERAQQIDLLIKDRSQQSSQSVKQKESLEEGGLVEGFDVSKSFGFLSVKGFLPNLGYGISEIAFGLIIWFVYGEFGDKIAEMNKNSWMFIAFISVTGIVRGIYHLYKAFKEKGVTSDDGDKESYNNSIDNSNKKNSVVRRNQ